MHLVRLVPFEEVRSVSVAGKKLLEFFVAHAPHHGGIRNLVPIQVQDWQNRAIANRIQELIGMPTGRQWTRFGFSVSNDAAHQQIRIVESSTVRMRDRVTKLSSFMNGARRFRGNVAGNSARKRELLEQPLHAFHALRDVRVDFAISAFQIRIRYNARAAMTRANDVDDIQVVALDQPIEVDIDEVQPGRGSPVSEQAWLDVLKFQRLAK